MVDGFFVGGGLGMVFWVDIVGRVIDFFGEMV